MAKYIVQLRRGTKKQWEDYEKDKPKEATPLAGELVVEYDNGIPRLKIGDGETIYSQLPYISVDSFILPKQATVTLNAKDYNEYSMWTHEQDEDGNYINRYSQVVKDDNSGINYFANVTITPNSKIDLQPNPEQLVVFHEKDLAFVTENDGGKVTVYCIGQLPPQDSYTIPITVTEVVVNG